MSTGVEEFSGKRKYVNASCGARKKYVNASCGAHLIFVTDTTDGVCVKKKLPGVNFYRFNAKNWQFTV